MSAERHGLRVNAPKGRLTAALRAEIAERKSEILALLRPGKAGARTFSQLPEDRSSPLSPAQERLWFLEQFQPGLPVFNLCRAVRIKGALDPRALERSVNLVLRRQQALRTKFLILDGRPAEVAAPAAPMKLPQADLRALAPEAREAQALRRLREEAWRPFDLGGGRLLRALLVRLGQAEHIFAISTHHLVADAWSMGILGREIWSIYEALTRGSEPALPPLAISYREYAVRRRELAQGEAMKRDLEFWRKQLADLPLLDLPSDRRRPARPSYRGGRRAVELPKSLTEALGALGRSEGATLFMTLLAAFQAHLGRYSGQEDIVVGAPAASRDSPQAEGLVGLFVNTLVLRGDLSGAPSFREFLRRVRRSCLNAYEHKELPFERLVSELNPPRALGRPPLFQAMFVLQNTPQKTPVVPGLEFSPVEIDNPYAHFDLSLYLRERGGRIIGYVEYAADQFEPSTIERMARHFQNLLEGIAANPDMSIARLPLLAPAERRQIVVEWNETAAEYPGQSCIHQLFEAQAERTPDAVALEFEGESWSYRQLNARANRLARELKNLRIGPEAPVGVLAERSLETVASLLAVLKAGGAYLPLDPSYPAERLRFMLADAGASVVLAQKRWAKATAGSGARILLIDELPLEKGGGSANVLSRATPDSAAYVIYTSGSTGTPKGVVGSHRGAVNRFAWMWQTYPFEPGEAACHKTSLSFVDSIWEIFGALLKGVPTLIVGDAIAKEPQRLVRCLAERKVTRLVAVPSLLNAMLERCPELGERLSRLKFCVSSGEALSAEQARRWRARLPRCRLINLYGASEVAGDVACYEVAGDEGAAVPIGRPIHNTRIYLLDRRMEPVPIGAAGEIYVGGASLARGYWNRPELTAEKFVADPFSGQNAARLYRTGDLGRYRADGKIEFLGRADQQVKIRGIRVEPGEIEAALRRHPAVNECVVAMARNARSESRPSQPSPVEGEEISDLERGLVAYLVPRGELPSAVALRGFLQRSLPDFMVPAAFVKIDAIPLLPGGKVDRGALPPLADRMQNSAGAELKAELRTETENLVAQIWRQVLKTDRIGAEDNFFALGGHSLVAAEAVAKIRAAFGREVTIAELFEAPTVAGLARLIDQKSSARAAVDLPPIVPAPGRRSFPLSPGQQRLFVFSQLLGGDFLNMPYGYRLDGPLNVEAVRGAIREIVRRHAILRTAFVDDGGGPRQLVRSRAALKISLHDLSSLGAERQAARVERLSREDAARCFDLERPPLMRALLLRLAEDTHLLLVTMHHLVTDQWSMGAFRRELALLYDALSKGVLASLPDLPFQFGDYVLWQRRLLAQGSFAASLAYWRRQLGAPPPRLDFNATARPKKKPRYQSTRLPFEIEQELCARIKKFAAAENLTPFMVFVGGLSLSVQRLTGARDIRIATLTANRSQPGTEALVGCFVNAVVLRVMVAPRMTLRELLEAVRGICLCAHSHGELPYEHLEELLERSGGRQNGAAYRVMLNYRALSAPVQEANGLTIASWQGKIRAGPSGIDISRLDVNVHLREVSTAVTGSVNFRSDLFDDRGMARFLNGYTGALKQLIDFPNRRISRLSLGD